MQKPALLIMAAGMGSRFGGLKQLEPLGPDGETLLDYSIFDALRAGFDRVVFIIRRDFEATFRERVGRRFESRVTVDYVFQELARLPADVPPPPELARTKPWGTAHAVWCAAEAVTGPFATINADDFYGRDAFVQLAAFFTRAGGATGAGPARLAMVGYRLDETLSEHGAVSRGVCVLDGRGHLASIAERTGIRRVAGGTEIRAEGGSPGSLAPEILVSMNCWGFTPAVFPLLERGLKEFLARLREHPDAKAESYLPDVIAAGIRDGLADVEVLPTNSRWFGVTYREDKPHVTAALAARIAAGDYPERLWRA